MKLNYTRWLLALLACVTLALAACGGGGGGGGGGTPGGGGGGTAPPPVPGQEEPPPDGTLIKTAKGADRGPAYTFTVGAAGGDFYSPDSKLVFKIPAGAATETTTFTVQPTENLMVNGLGDSYKVTPSLSTLKSTVDFSLVTSLAQWRGSNAAESTQSFSVAYQGADGQWRGAVDPVVQFTDSPFAERPSPFAKQAATGPKWAVVSNKIAPKPADQAAGDELYESLAFWVDANLVPVFSAVTKGGKVRMRMIGAKGQDCNAPPSNRLPDLCRGLFAKGPPVLGTPSSGTFVEISKDLFEYTAPAEVPEQNPVGLSITYSPIEQAPAQVIYTAVVKVTESAIAYRGKFSYRYEWLGTKFTSSGTTTEYPAFEYTVTGNAAMRYKTGLLGNGYEIEFADALAQGYTSVRTTNNGKTVLTCTNEGGGGTFENFNETDRALRFANDGADKTKYRLEFAPAFGDYPSLSLLHSCSDGVTRQRSMTPFIMGTYTSQSPLVPDFNFANTSSDDRQISGTTTVEYANYPHSFFDEGAGVTGPVRVTYTWNFVRVDPDPAQQ